ncbi:MAG TPA: TonB-dependent receptor [Longimicrobiaceae bacterium]
MQTDPSVRDRRRPPHLFRWLTSGRSLWLAALFSALPTLSWAQTEVSGRVIDAQTSAPLAGAQVTVQGTNVGTVTNASGDYSLTMPAGSSTLVFSMLGYSSQEVATEGRSVVNVALMPSAVSLEGLVVVGYTTQELRDISGAVAAVSDTELQARKVATLEEALKGRVAGVNIKTSGEPGQAAAITVRGQNFLYNSSPLYVVDGFYMTQNPNLNPADIASIQILKDASAASQYGAQAANGVVVITTKRGQATGRNGLRISSYYGVQEMNNRIEVMNAREWAEFAKMAYENARAQNPNADPVPAGVLAILDGTHTVDTDWQDVILQDGAIQDHNVSMSGATEDANYFLSGGYTRQEGTIKKTDFERFSLRVNSELRRGRLTLGENISLSRSNRNNLVLNEGSPLINAMRMPPGIPVFDEANNPPYGYGSAFLPNFGTNPLGLIEQRDDQFQRNQVFGTVFGEYSLLDGLNYRLNIGFSYDDLENRFFQKAGGLPRQNNPRDPAFLNVGRDDYTSLLFENLLSYNQTFGGLHDVNAVVGYTEQKTERDWLWAHRRGYADESLRQIDAGTENFDNRGFAIESRLRSFLGRINYSYDGRYLLTASFRRDGSSRFGPGNRWGNFWSGSAGWVVSEEPFFSSIPLLGGANFLKLRASYGVLGNQDFADYQFAGLVVQNRSYLFGESVAPGAIQLDLANPDIKWQENTQQNYGFDLSMLDNQLSITADYYISRSDDLLVRAPLPPTLGSGTAPFINAGSVRNRGLELSLTHRYGRGNFELNTTANLTTIDNEVLSLGNGAQPIMVAGVARTAVGHPIGTLWTYKMDGIFQSEEEVQNHTTTLEDGTVVVLQPNAQPGDVRYADLNKDGAINDQDKYAAGDAVPDLEGGLFFDGRIGRFDFTAGLRGSFGNEIFNEVRWWMLRMDDNSNLPKGTKPWTPENPSATTPRALIGGLAADNARRESDRWVEDGSFVRIQNLQIGYSLPESLLSRAGLDARDARVYVNVQNLYTFTDYTGFDPEFVGFLSDVSTLERGIDFGRVYPSPRTISVGFDIGL